MKNFKKIEIKSVKELRSWLKENHTKEESFWLISYKKSTPEYYVSWGDMVDQLLCYGWIDSIIKRIDNQRTMRLISKRRKNSVWSLVNKKKIAHLIKNGLMQSSGLEVIKRAKKDGSWNFLNEVDHMIIPNDLMKEFKKYPQALKNFEEFPKSARRGTLYWIKSAKRPETREARIIEAAFFASENLRMDKPR